MSLPASDRLSLTNLSEETRSIYKPVLKDFRDFYSETSHLMNDLDRDTCQLALDNVAIPSTAWEEPDQHPLSAVAIERREACFPTFYMLKLLYMGHYLTLFSRYRGIRCTDPGILATAFFVRLRFKDSPAAKLAVEAFGTEIFWLARGKMAQTFIRARFESQNDDELVEEDEQSKDGQGHNHNDAVLHRQIISVQLQNFEASSVTAENRENESEEIALRQPPRTGQHWGLGFAEGDEVASWEDTDVEEAGLTNDGKKCPTPLRSTQIEDDSDDQTLVGLQMLWVSRTKLTDTD